MTEVFGIMDQAYFVSRSAIINWINTTLQLQVEKIEELGNGSVYCQLVDALFPGKIQLNKVNWNAKHEYEFIHNLKILQNAFQKLQIKRHIEVEKLSKGKYQDNLEFIQWLKRFVEANSGPEQLQNYDAIGRRNGNSKHHQPKGISNAENIITNLKSNKVNQKTTTAVGTTTNVPLHSVPFNNITNMPLLQYSSIGVQAFGSQQQRQSQEEGKPQWMIYDQKAYEQGLRDTAMLEQIRDVFWMARENKKTMQAPGYNGPDILLSDGLISIVGELIGVNMDFKDQYTCQEQRFEPQLPQYQSNHRSVTKTQPVVDINPNHYSCNQSIPDNDNDTAMDEMM